MHHPAVAWSGSLLLAFAVSTAGAEPAFAPDAGLMLRCGGTSREQAGDDKSRRRPWRVLGWLYRAIRNEDVATRGAPPLLFYLRSPLLARFADDSDCPEETGAGVLPRCEATAVVAESRARTVDVVLPQLGAATASELIEAVQRQLEAGVAVTLRTAGGGEAVLRPGGEDGVVVTACDAGTGREGRGPPDVI